MDYSLKVVIDGQEILEQQEVSVVENDKITEPSITDAFLLNSACSKTMEIGATASDMLIFTILNPHKTSFDGDAVSFYIMEDEQYEPSKAQQIEEEVGDAVTDEILITEDVDVVEEGTEEEEDSTAEEIEDADEIEASLEEGLVSSLFGEEIEETTTEDVPDVGSDWIKIGTYYVYSQTNNNDGSITLVCYDGFIKLSGMYRPASHNTTVSSMYTDLRNKISANCGITVAEEEFGDYEDNTITLDFNCSYREALGYFAGIVGGFVEFDADGVCGISQYAFDDNILIDTELTKYEETSAGEMVVELVSCNRSVDSMADDIIEAGEGGQAITYADPFVTQSMLNAVYDGYRGMRFCGAEIGAEWHAGMMAGEFVRIFTEAEYTNYVMLRNNLEQNSGTMTADEIATIQSGMNSLGKIVLISYQQIDFSGNARTTITSICESEATKENKPLAPTDAKFRRVYADVVDTKLLVAQKADIEDLQAQNAVFTNVEIQTGTASDFTATKLSFNTAAGAKFTADQITALDAAFDQAVVGTVSANNIESVLGTFSTLIAEDFTADEIKAATAYLQTALIKTLHTNYLSANFAQIDAANISSATISNAWVNKLMVQTGLIASEGAVFYLDAIKVDASSIQAGTIDVERLIVSVPDQEDPTIVHKYMVTVDPSTSQTTYEKLDGDVIEDLTITADKIVAGAITADKITTQNIVGSGGWINLRNGTFNYVNATTGQGISWDGTNLNITGSITITGGNVYTKTEVDSSVASAIDNIEVGGRNYFTNSRHMGGYNVGSLSRLVWGDEFSHFELDGTTSNWNANMNCPSERMDISMLDGSDWVVSFEYQCTVDYTVYFAVAGAAVPVHTTNHGNATRTKYRGSTIALPNTNGEWVKFEFPFSYSLSDLTSGSGDVNSWFFQIYGRTNNATIKIRKTKLEKGNKATDWTPAPEDLIAGTGNILHGSGNLTNGSTTWSGGTYYNSGSGGAKTYNYDVSDSPVPRVTKGFLSTISTINTTNGFAQSQIPFRKSPIVMSVWAKGVAGDIIALQPIWRNASSGKGEAGSAYFTIPDSNWHRYEFAKTPLYDHRDDYNGSYNCNGGYVYHTGKTVGNTLTVIAPKIEYGTKATDWSLSAEEIDDYAKTATNYLTFDTNNGLDVGYQDNKERVNIKGDGVRLYSDVNGTQKELAHFLKEEVLMKDKDEAEFFKAKYLSSNTAIQNTFSSSVDQADHATQTETFTVNMPVTAFVSMNLTFNVWGQVEDGEGETGWDVTDSETMSITSLGTTVTKSVDGINVTGKLTQSGQNFTLVLTSANSSTLRISFVSGTIIFKTSRILSQLSAGMYPDSTDTLFKVGNGTDVNNTSNALELDWLGNLKLAGDVIDKTGNRLCAETHQNGKWMQIGDVLIQYGKFTFSSGSGANWAQRTFPRAFANNPVIVATPYGTRNYNARYAHFSISNVSKTSFRLEVYRSGTVSAKATWIALGYAPTT